MNGRLQASGLSFVRYVIAPLLMGPDGDAVNRSLDPELFPDDGDSVVRVTEFRPITSLDLLSHLMFDT